MSTTPIGDAFDALESENQWAYVLALPKEIKERIEINLYNDDTSISFGEIEEDDDGYVAQHHFKQNIGDSPSVYNLLTSLGFTLVVNAFWFNPVVRVWATTKEKEVWT